MAGEVRLSQRLRDASSDAMQAYIDKELYAAKFIFHDSQNRVVSVSPLGRCKPDDEVDIKVPRSHPGVISQAWIVYEDQLGYEILRMYMGECQTGWTLKAMPMNKDNVRFTY